MSKLCRSLRRIWRFSAQSWSMRSSDTKPTIPYSSPTWVASPRRRFTFVTKVTRSNARLNRPSRPDGPSRLSQAELQLVRLYRLMDRRHHGAAVAALFPRRSTPSKAPAATVLSWGHPWRAPRRARVNSSDARRRLPSFGASETHSSRNCSLTHAVVGNGDPARDAARLGASASADQSEVIPLT